MTEEELLQHYRERAKALFADDDLNIDAEAVVSIAEGGAWVASWVWVPDDTEEE